MVSNAIKNYKNHPGINSIKMSISVPDNNDRVNLDEMVTKSIEKYKIHPGITAIKTSLRQKEKFRLSNVHSWNVKGELEVLDRKKV